MVVACWGISPFDLGCVQILTMTNSIIQTHSHQQQHCSDHTKVQCCGTRIGIQICEVPGPNVPSLVMQR